MNAGYLDTVRLLLDVTPEVFSVENFAMKGGTALNFFTENMPRLSVDIDVVYTNHQNPREESMEAIASTLHQIQARLKKKGVEGEFRPLSDAEETKVFLKRGDVTVKVEVNHVFRGTVLPVRRSRLVAEAREFFMMDFEVPTLEASELYGSKLVAALDRQHPRDFFDVAMRYERGGLNPDIIECFVCYLAGHNQPLHKVLFPRDQDMSRAFENEFAGMTREPVSLESLNQTRTRLKRDVLAGLEARHREFMLGLVRGEPDWSLMTCKHLSELPALRWKLQNVEKLKSTNPKKFDLQYKELVDGFGM